MKNNLRISAAAAVALSLGMASSANAATTATADAQAEILSALAVVIDVTNDTLDFGSLADGGIVGSANVVLDPTGTISTCPATVLCAGVTAAPTFHVTGAAGNVVNITFPSATTTLTESVSTDTMTVQSFTTGAPSNQITLSAAGTQDFTVGGTLVMTPGLSTGTYTGTFDVAVAYN